MPEAAKTVFDEIWNGHLTKRCGAFGTGVARGRLHAAVWPPENRP